MKTKLLAAQILSGFLGIGLGVWWFSPGQTVEELLEAEHAYVDEDQKRMDAEDQAELRGSCVSGTVKALPSGLVTSCSSGGVWLTPVKAGAVPRAVDAIPAT